MEKAVSKDVVMARQSHDHTWLHVISWASSSSGTFCSFLGLSLEGHVSTEPCTTWTPFPPICKNSAPLGEPRRRPRPPGRTLLEVDRAGAAS